MQQKIFSKPLHMQGLFFALPNCLISFYFKSQNMKLAFFILLSFFTTIVFSQKTYIYCGQLIDVKKNEVQKEMTIVVEKNKITDLLKGYATTSAGDKIIDLKAMTVMPGLIDMHVHLEGETRKGGVIDRFIRNPADIALESVKYVHTTLMTGFTTVRDLGGTGVNISLRDAIAKGYVIGPRVFTAGKSIA